MAKALLVIGIHREELAFGRAVAAQLDPAHIDVLEIPEGLPGRHPRPDQCFQHDRLHRELYLQLLPRMRHCSLLIDLHTGLDEVGHCADLYSRDPARLAACLQAPQPRLIQLGDVDDHFPQGKTIIPPEVWQSPDCLYVGLEIYLKKVGAGETAEVAYATALIDTLAKMLEPPKVQTPVIDSEALFGNTREIQIDHGGDIYRLQRTRAGKLILTK